MVSGALEVGLSIGVSDVAVGGSEEGGVVVEGGWEDVSAGFEVGASDVVAASSLLEGLVTTE